MPGGLLNIISEGNQNIILNGNPSKTFFKSVYSKFTNFGIQKFRVDYQGQRTLKINDDTIISFKLPRHGNLVLDTFLVINMPDIWSPILPPTSNNDSWKPYQFKWIEHLGFNIIKNVKLTIGGQIIQQFTGEYLKNLVDRDYSNEKKELTYKMIGHTTDMYDPQNAYNRNNRYPNAFFLGDEYTINPSIQGRTLYIPLHFWFMNSSKSALPLCSIQYSEVQIEVTIRPIYEMFTINDVTLSNQDFNLDNPIQASPQLDLHQLYRFLEEPKSTQLLKSDYINTTNSWNDDTHLLVNYAFLTDEEVRVFALNEQSYLIRDVKEDIYHNITGTKKVKLNGSYW